MSCSIHHDGVACADHRGAPRRRQIVRALILSAPRIAQHIDLGNVDMKMTLRSAGKRPATACVLLRVIALAGISALCTMAPAVAAEPFGGPILGMDAGYEDSGRIRNSGMTYGAFAGYDLKVGSKLLLGAEGRVGDSAVTRTVTRTGAAFTTVAGSAIGRHAGASVRVGLMAGRGTLIYARGGWETVKVKATTTRTAVPPTTTPGPVVEDFSFDDDTSVFGLGIERRVKGPFRVRLSYDYAENFDRHQVRLGIVAGF
jgi:outer membrane immunogenic protein